MNKRNRLPVVGSCFSMVLLLLAVGCSSNPLRIKPIAMTSDPSSQLEAFSQEIELARQERVTFLAPGWFKKAETSYNEAKATRDEGGSV